MRCPFCNYEESKVIDSRPSEDGSTIRRRRECISCSQRFTTYEKLEIAPIIVVKKDQTRQFFDRTKLKNGILRACEKRPVPVERIDQIVNEIESQISNSLIKEVTTKELGERVMEKLKEIDEIAYIRFASVYRQFKDIDTFLNEVKKLLK